MSRVTVALHRPIYPRNIGMCARAMANMGLTRLVIVNAQCELTDEAKQGAAHAQEILRNAVIYKSLAEFQENEGEGIRIALSGKDHRLQEAAQLTDVLERMVSESDHPFHDGDIPIYLFFGTESDGLSPEEMEICNFICRLPTFGEITSLNISHAVLLASYLTVMALGKTTAPHLNKEPRIERQYYPTETIKRWLETLGFDLSARRVTIEKTLNRIFLSRCPTQEELRIIDTVLQQTVRKLRNTKSE